MFKDILICLSAVVVSNVCMQKKEVYIIQKRVHKKCRKKEESSSKGGGDGKWRQKC